MPRIDLTPDDFDPSSGDGTPTIDVCKTCSDDFTFGDHFTHHEHGNCTVTGTDVEHPPYNECDYQCDECSTQLTDEDD